MEAGIGNRASPLWRVLYDAAIIEVDRTRLLSIRIPEAEHAIAERVQHLNRLADTSEAEALANALTVLRDLRRMAGKDDESAGVLT
jgi:hypothetical protein